MSDGNPGKAELRITVAPDEAMSGEPEAERISDEWATWAFAGMTRFYEWDPDYTLEDWQLLPFKDKKTWCNAASIAPSSPEPEAKPTIEELEAIMKEDDLEIAILPTGEVTTQKKPVVHALEDIVASPEPEVMLDCRCPKCGDAHQKQSETPLEDCPNCGPRESTGTQNVLATDKGRCTECGRQILLTSQAPAQEKNNGREVEALSKALLENRIMAADLLREKVGRFISALGKRRSIESITKESWAKEFWEMCEEFNGGPLTTMQQVEAPAQRENDERS